MPDKIRWNNAAEIAVLLQERFPNTAPEVPSDLEIAGWIREIPELADEMPPSEQLPACIAAIRSAWRRERE